MRPIDFPSRPQGLDRPRPPGGRIQLLNGRWHENVHPRVRVGSCAGCAEDVVADERAVYLQGELYHLRCASHGKSV